jgi:outer membrane protein
MGSVMHHQGRARITTLKALAWLAVALLPLATAAAQTPADTVRLDLPHSIAIALQNATPIQLGGDTVRLSGIGLLESYGRFLPNLTASVGGFGQQGLALLSGTSLAPADAQFYGMSYQLSASVNLFNGFRDREHMRAALLTRDAAQNSLDRAREQVAFDVSQAYFQVALDRRLAGVTDANLVLSKAREDQLAEQVRIGTKAPPDLYRQQAQARADEVAVIDANNRVQNDETALLNRLRLDATKPYAIIEPALDTDRVAPADLQLDTVLREALARRPDLVAAQNRAVADKHEMQLARGELLPQLALRFDYIGNGRVFGRELVDGKDQLTVAQHSVADQLSNQRYGQVSLGLSWNLFDGYRERLDMERATVADDRDRLNIEDLRLRVGSEVQTALGNYYAAEQKLVASAASLDAAQQAFDAVQGRFDVGLASVVDVLTAQTALTQARALREESLENVALQKAVLRYAAGTPPA